MSDIVIEERYVSLQGIFTIPNIKTKNFLSFSFCGTKAEQYYISGKETFDLRVIKKTYAASNYKIIKNINNLNIIAEIDIFCQLILKKSSLTFGKDIQLTVFLRVIAEEHLLTSGQLVARFLTGV